MKILIYGVGGVGGFIGSHLQKSDFDISYIARGTRFEFLKKNGQIDQRVLFEKNTDLIRTILIWEYESEEAFKKCQAFHSNWSKFESNFASKYQSFRVEEISSWL